MRFTQHGITMPHEYVPSIFTELVECSPVRHGLQYYWWRSIAAAYMLRPNEPTLSLLAKYRNLDLAANEQCIGRLIIWLYILTILCFSSKCQYARVKYAFVCRINMQMTAMQIFVCCIKNCGTVTHVFACRMSRCLTVTHLLNRGIRTSRGQRSRDGIGAIPNIFERHRDVMD